MDGIKEARPAPATDHTSGAFRISSVPQPADKNWGLGWLSAETLVESMKLLNLLVFGERSSSLQASTYATNLVQVLARFFFATQRLEKLELNAYWLSYEHMLILEPALLSCSRLTELSLDGCTIPKDSAVVLARCLRNHPHLRHVRFSEKLHVPRFDHQEAASGEFLSKMFVDPAVASPAPGIDEQRLHRAPLRSFHAGINDADDIASLFQALVTSSSRLNCLRIGYDGHSDPSREKNGMQHLHTYIPELVYLQEFYIYANAVYLFMAESLLQALQRNGSLRHLSVSRVSNRFWTSDQLRFVDAFCWRNVRLPKMLSKGSCRELIDAVSDDEGDALVPTLFSATMPMRRMTPTFILRGLLSMQEWNR